MPRLLPDPDGLAQSRATALGLPRAWRKALRTPDGVEPPAFPITPSLHSPVWFSSLPSQVSSSIYLWLRVHGSLATPIPSFPFSPRQGDAP
jgi:hypothetical protein